MKARTYLIIAAFAVFASCAAPPEARPAAEVQTAKQADSELVVLWPCAHPLIQTAGAFVDGVERAALRRNRYAQFPVSSGDHEIKFKFIGALGVTMPSTKGVFHFESGKRHYVVFSYQYDMTGIVPIGGVPLIMGEPSKSVVEVSAETAGQLMASMQYGELK